jgi:hypothetical protein
MIDLADQHSALTTSIERQASSAHRIAGTIDGTAVRVRSMADSVEALRRLAMECSSDGPSDGPSDGLFKNVAEGSAA